MPISRGGMCAGLPADLGGMKDFCSVAYWFAHRRRASSADPIPERDERRSPVQ